MAGTKSATSIRRKPSTIVLGGEEYSLQFTLNALADLEDAYGSVDGAFKDMEAGKFKAIRCVLWAGMLEDHPELTERQVGSLIDMQNLVELMNAVNTATEADLPNEGDIADPN